MVLGRQPKSLRALKWLPDLSQIQSYGKLNTYQAAPFGMGRKVMYYLTKKGAVLLAELDRIDLAEISYTIHKGGIQRAQDGGEVSIIRADFQHKERYICAFLALSPRKYRL